MARIPLTPLEQEALDTLIIVQDHYSAGRPRLKRDDLEVMGQVRDTIRKLENKSFGCSTGKHSTLRVCKCNKGFTLIELMLTIAVIAILALIFVPKMSALIARAQDARTLGNLGVMRSSLAAYYGANEGLYPGFPAPFNTDAGYGTLLEDTLVPRYLPAIPLATPSGWKHPQSREVFLVWNMSGNNAGYGWKYDANKFDGIKPPDWRGTFGQIKVLCTHRDSKGRLWEGL